MSTQSDVANGPTSAEADNPGLIADGTGKEDVSDRGHPAARITDVEVNPSVAGEANPKSKDKRLSRSRLPTVVEATPGVLGRRFLVPRGATIRREQ